MPAAEMKLMPARVESPPLMSIGTWRVPRSASTNWMAPETTAQTPNAVIVAPASAPKAVAPTPTAASVLIAALTRSGVASGRRYALASEATTSING